MADIEPEQRSIARESARDDVRLRVREYVRNRSSCPDELITDSCLWPHLAVALEGLSGATSASVGLGRKLKRAFLHALAMRLDLSARQVLVLERALAREHDPAAPASVSALSAALHHDAAPLLDILDLYPGLDELLADHVRCSVEYATKAVRALAQDWPEVRARFGWSADPQDIAVTVLPSDHHGGGETVVRLGDRSGHGRALYKPRPLQLEETLTAGLRELAEASSDLRGWKLPDYLLRAGHGWVEFVDSTACSTQAEVARYYRRAGVLLALATTLGITDLHCDNLICHADSPVPIDLETALHHRQRPGAPSRGGMVLPRVMEWNALATGLLPTWIWKGGDRRGVDLSGLGAIGEQWCSLPLQQFVARDTPLEQLVRDGVQLLPSENTVRLKAQRVAPWEHIDALLAGFEEGVDLLGRSADALADLISDASGLEARFLARPTAGYHYAIQASLHPYYLHDPQRRRSFLTSALTDTTRVEPWLVQAEARACYWADIPRFVTWSASPGILERYYGGHGALSDQEHVLGCDAVRDDVRFLSDATRMTFERKIICGSMLSLQTAHEGGDPRIVVTERVDPATVEWAPEVGRRAAAAAAQFLLDYLASSGSDPDLWYGFRNAPGGHHEFGLIGNDLYSGTAGVAYGLGLGWQAGFVGRDVVETLTRRLVVSAEEHLRTPMQRLGGAYFGELSAVLPLVANLRSLGGVDEARLLARCACAAVAESLQQPGPQRAFWGFDLLGGVAGALTVMVELHRIFDDDSYLPVVARLVAMLDESSATAGERIVWPQPTISASPDQALGGLSHGQIGCAVALAEAVPVLEPVAAPVAARAAVLALGAAGWEIDRFDPVRQSFPDVRRRSTTGAHGEFAWSHGAPGTFLALRRIRRCTPAPEIDRFLAECPVRRVIETAIAERPPPNNPSLCHGALGNQLIGPGLLATAGPEDALDSELAAWNQLGYWAHHETLSLRRHAVDAPGFMVGRAGNLAGWAAVVTGRRERLPFLPSAFHRGWVS